MGWRPSASSGTQIGSVEVNGLRPLLLRRALGQAERWNVIPRNPAALVDPPRAERSEVDPLGPEEIDQLLAAAQGDPLEALYVLAVTTGLRQGELLGLRWQDVDLGAGSLAVRQQVQRTPGGWAFTEPKTAGSRRVVRLPRIAVDAVSRHRVDQVERRLAHGLDWTDHDLVFPNSRGAPIERQNLARRSFKPLLARAGLPPIRFHDLRHTAATLLLAKGVHSKVVQERLGHSSIGVTMDVYSHVLPSIQNEAVDALDRHFGPDRDRVAVNVAVKAGSGASETHGDHAATR
jgi:integrase